MTIHRLSVLQRHLAPASAAASTYDTARDPLTDKTVGVVAKDAGRASEGYTLFSSGCAVATNVPSTASLLAHRC
jgi:hypothetical protein